MDFIESGDLDNANHTLEPFPPLRPLAVLLCIEQFRGDVDKQRRLIDKLFPDPTRFEGPMNVEKGVVAKRLDPMEEQVQLLRWRARISQWYAEQSRDLEQTRPAMGHSSRPSTVAGTATAAAAAAAAAAATAATAGTSVASRSSERDSDTLAHKIYESLRSQSFLEVFASNLGDLKEDALLYLLQRHPRSSSSSSPFSSSSSAMPSHPYDHGMIVLRSYYAVRRFMSLLSGRHSGDKHSVEGDTVEHSFGVIRKYAMSIMHFPSRVSLLRLLLSLVFLRYEKDRDAYAFSPQVLAPTTRGDREGESADVVD